MKKLVLYLGVLCLLIPFLGRAQNGIDIGLVAEHVQLPSKSMQSYGIMAYYKIDQFTLNYHLGIGPSSQGGMYVHAPAGAAAAAFLLSKIDSTRLGSRILGVAGILSLLIPEGVGFYTSEGERFSTHVSVNPLGYEYWKRKDPYLEEWRLSGSVVFRLRAMVLPKYRIFLSPHIGPVLTYKDGHLGFKGGLVIGYSGEGD
jgi:hypothetical protein